MKGSSHNLVLKLCWAARRMLHKLVGEVLDGSTASTLRERALRVRCGFLNEWSSLSDSAPNNIQYIFALFFLGGVEGCISFLGSGVLHKGGLLISENFLNLTQTAWNNPRLPEASGNFKKLPKATWPAMVGF